MRNGQKRMRGRGGHRKSQNPLTRVYESNGPDVKIRGTANHIAEKYLQLARDAQSSGDPVGAENYNQHAEHYFRLIATAQEQMRQQNPYYQQQQQQQQQQGGDDIYDDDGGDDGQPYMGTDAPQPYLPPNAQPFPPRDQQQARPQQQPAEDNGGGLPAFITGGGQPQPGANGHDQGERGQGGQGGQGGQDRFGGGYRRRRRHRGSGGFRGERPDFAGAQGGGPGEGGDEPPAGE
jgi:Domain of unknown function (DUF4167)